MLRDRLTDALSDLASSRTHVHEVQEAYAVERRTSQKAKADVQAAGSFVLSTCAAVSYAFSSVELRIGELTCALKLQQRESLDATTLAADLEARLEESKTG